MLHHDVGAINRRILTEGTRHGPGNGPGHRSGHLPGCHTRQTFAGGSRPRNSITPIANQRPRVWLAYLRHMMPFPNLGHLCPVILAMHCIRSKLVKVRNCPWATGRFSPIRKLTSSALTAFDLRGSRNRGGNPNCFTRSPQQSSQARWPRPKQTHLQHRLHRLEPWANSIACKVKDSRHCRQHRTRN